MTKEMLLNAAHQMPDSFSLDELFERLIFVEKIEEGLKSLGEEGGIPHDELKRQMKEFVQNRQNGKRGMVA